ncbi:MAG: hypothetical protein HRS57_03220 [Mycoplasmataceae bacterium]|nr:hypothetical protein [Mycoplasmataceae bacterium]
MSIFKESDKEWIAEMSNLKEATLLNAFLIFSKDVCNYLHLLLSSREEPWSRYFLGSSSHSYETVKNSLNNMITKDVFEIILRKNFEREITRDFIVLIDKSFENFVADLIFLDPFINDQAKVKIYKKKFNGMNNEIIQSIYYIGIENTKLWTNMSELRKISNYNKHNSNLSNAFLNKHKELKEEKSSISINNSGDLVELVMSMLNDFLEYIKINELFYKGNFFTSRSSIENVNASKVNINNFHKILIEKFDLEN